MNCPSCGAPATAGLQFCQACGRPLTGGAPSTPAAPVAQSPVQPPAASVAAPPPLAASSMPASGYAASPPAKSGGGALPWIIGGCGCLAVVGVLVAILGFGAWYIGEHPELISQNMPVESVPTTTPGTDPGSSATTPSTAGVTRLDLTWNEKVDMDLEIWNAAGENLLDRAFNLCGEDVKDGTMGREWFEFKRYSDEDDYSSGTYMVSLYFAARPEGSTVEQASATITVTKPDGSTVTRQKTINWEPGRDQWHAFTINAATGAITVKDQFIRVQQENN